MNTTFDSVVELEKIAKWHPNSNCVMRIRADDPHAGISFGIKYGANEDEFELLLKAAQRLGLAVTGECWLLLFRAATTCILLTFTHSGSVHYA